MSDYEPNVVLTTGEYQVVGTRPIRHDVLERVTGTAMYSDDIQLPGQLFAKVLRSPHAHARIRSIDASAALALEGVRAVVTSRDLAQVSGTDVDEEGLPVDLGFQANNCLAGDKALYKGHAVAAVAANTRDIAEEAIAKIHVDYEVLDPVIDARDAMREGAPILHDDLNVTVSGPNEEDVSKKFPNVAKRLEFSVGDIEKGFQEADVIVEREYRTVATHHGYI